jgi:uncharacterized protein (DUF58 family)
MALNSPYLDADVLNRITPLGLRAGQVMEGSITGQHRSPMHGVSPEFADYREYTPGDDPKNLDWRVFARSDRYYIKRFEEESNLNCTVILDTSASMRYRGEQATRSKYDTAATLTACLARILIQQRDAVGLVTIDEQVGQTLTPKSNPLHFAQLLRILDESQPQKSSRSETELGPQLKSVADRLSRGGMVIVISDLLCELDPLFEAFAQLKYGRQEVLILQVLDADEIELPFNRSIIFKDMEGSTGEEIYGEPWAFRNAYRQAMIQFIDETHRRCRAMGLGHVLFRSDESLGGRLAEYLHERKSQ